MKVSKRNGFSDRNEIKPENNEIQVKNFNMRTRIQLCNMMSRLYFSVFKGEYYRNDEIQTFLQYVLGEIYAEPINTLEVYREERIFEIIDKTIMEDEYDDVLTLIEATVQYLDTYLKETNNPRYYDEYMAGYSMVENLYDTVNKVFEREYIGYRFIRNIITLIKRIVKAQT